MTIKCLQKCKYHVYSRKHGVYNFKQWVYRVQNGMKHGFLIWEILCNNCSNLNN